MDLSYDLVASKCAQQMAKYQECVLKNQDGNWGDICRPQGKALAACADASVPHLSQLKASCAAQIHAYRTCLDSNSALGDEELGSKCEAPLKALWACSERTMAGIEKEGKSLGVELGGVVTVPVPASVDRKEIVVSESTPFIGCGYEIRSAFCCSLKVLLEGAFVIGTMDDVPIGMLGQSSALLRDQDGESM